MHLYIYCWMYFWIFVFKKYSEDNKSVFFGLL